MKPKQKFTIAKPDDFHLHVRGGSQMRAVVEHTAKQFGRAIIMPNLKDRPIITEQQASDYRKEILAACPEGSRFDPRIALYLTSETSVQNIKHITDYRNIIAGYKLYPAGATTNSENGVVDIKKMYPAFGAMEKHNIPLLVHGEVTDDAVDIFDREKVFIERYLADITEIFSELRIVLEHVTTKEGVEFVESCNENVAATITPQHLLCNRNDLLVGGLKPHYYCLPVLKGEPDRQALVKAATSGNPKFFLGTDSAPHEKHAKESDCGCAGCFTAHAAMELYAEAFERSGHADWVARLERFASVYGSRFYGLEPSRETITLAREDWVASNSYPFGKEDDGSEQDDWLSVIPFWAGKTLHWKLKD